MANWTRRDLAKAGMMFSAGQLTSTLPEAAAQQSPTAEALPDTTPSPQDLRGSRERLLMDRGWRFALGHASDPAKDFGFGKMATQGTFGKSGDAGGPTAGAGKHPFDDSAWEQIDLPHDWAVELPFVLQHDLVSHGGKPLGRDFPATSVGWYRRSFDIPASDLGRRITLEFDGIYRDARIFLNGHYLTANFSGYAPVEIDVTDFLNYGSANLLAVRVDASYAEGWFYEGAGIYRHVWLNKMAPVHFARWGTAVRSTVKPQVAELQVGFEIQNRTGSPAACTVRATVLDPAGKAVAHIAPRPVTTQPDGTHGLSATATVRVPELWSLESPRLYKLAAVLESGGKQIDTDEVTFGIRRMRFDADKGFFLNGKPVKIKGTCNHQDHAGVGIALPDSLQEFRIRRLKEMGSNAYRTSHNPPTPELLDTCDRLGMLVMDETRDFSSGPEGLNELERMVRRDRNHPSVVLWSIANEEPQQGTERGAKIGTTMKRLVRRLDPTRPITAAMNGAWGTGLSGVVDVQGFNYGQGKINAYRARFPRQPLIGTEVASTVSTRGIYANDAKKGYVSAYDTNKPHWGNTAEEFWTFYSEREWLSGAFIWTGFDYRGEPTPYHLPCISSHFGLMDTCGFPKDNFFYYRAWWRVEPSLHVFPHWTWPGREGQPIEVWCYTNQASAELLLNGQSLGVRPIQKNGHAVWEVPYAPGMLEVRAMNGGNVVLTERRETAGVPARIMLTTDRSRLPANAEATAVLSVSVVDAAGRPVPTAADKISFELTGPGRFLGVGNGDPSCYEPDRPKSATTAERSAFNGLCMALVQTRSNSGEIAITASAPGLQPATIKLTADPAQPRPSI